MRHKLKQGLQLVNKKIKQGYKRKFVSSQNRKFTVLSPIFRTVIALEDNKQK